MQRESHYAAGVIIFHDREGERNYLLLRSALTRRVVWEFPKGGIEKGESEQQAAERELQEETGISAGDFAIQAGFREEEHYMFTRGAPDDRRLVVKRVVYFLAEVFTEQVRISREASEFRWLPFPEAYTLVRFPEKRRVLQAAEDWLNRNDAPRA